MPKAKPSVSVKPSAASKETDEMKMRKNVGKLADLAREGIAEASTSASDSSHRGRQIRLPNSTDFSELKDSLSLKVGGGSGGKHYPDGTYVLFAPATDADDVDGRHVVLRLSEIDNGECRSKYMLREQRGAGEDLKYYALHDNSYWAPGPNQTVEVLGVIKASMVVTLHEEAEIQVPTAPPPEAQNDDETEMVAVTVSEDAYGYKKGQVVIAQPTAVQLVGDQVLISRELGECQKYEIMVAATVEGGLATSFTTFDGLPFEPHTQESFQNKGVVLGATKAREKTAAPNAPSNEDVETQEPKHAYAFGRDFGPISDRALSLIEQHKGADKRYRDADDAADVPSPGQPTSEMLEEQQAAYLGELKAGIACVAFWWSSKSSADRIAIEQYGESDEIYGQTIKEAIEYPGPVIEALAQTLIKSETQHIAASDEIIRAIEAHRRQHGAALTAPVDADEVWREELWTAADNAFEKLLSQKPESLADLRAVAAYLNEDTELLDRVMPCGGPGAYTATFFNTLLNA